MSIRPTKWTESRIQIVEEMLAEGKTYAEIGAHPRIQANAGAVCTLASRKGLTASSAAWRRAARARGTTVAVLRSRVNEILAGDGVLISNILDDGVM